MNASPAVVMALFGGLSWEWLTAILVLLVGVAFFVVVAAMASRYKKIAPNEVGIFYGRRYTYKDSEGRTQTRGSRVVAGRRLAALADRRAPAGHVHRRHAGGH